MAIILEYLVIIIQLGHQNTRKIKITAPSEEEQKTDDDVFIIDEEVQEKQTFHVVTEEER